MTVNAKEFIKFYFESCDDASLHLCRNEKCRTRKPYSQAKGTGFTNFQNNLRACIGRSFQEIYKKQKKESGENQDRY